jgi:hypothetical protein
MRMGNRSFEMYEYRQIITRMRLGDSDRILAQTGLIGRKKASRLREIVLSEGWLDKEKPLPDEAVLKAVLGIKPDKEPQTSLILPYQQEVKGWYEQGIWGTTIHQALVRKYGFNGSYSSVRRFLQGLKRDNPQATVILDFQTAEAAQVDFGSGSKIIDAMTGEIITTWIFVMTLARIFDFRMSQEIEEFYRLEKDGGLFFS